MLSVTSIVSFPQIAPFRGGVAALDSLAAPVAGAPDTSGAVVGARSAPSVSRLAPESVASIQEDAGGNQPEAGQGSADEKAADEKSGAAAKDAQGLTEADRRKIEKLKQRDREVREHERAHATAGGSIAVTSSARSRMRCCSSAARARALAQSANLFKIIFFSKRKVGTASNVPLLLARTQRAQ